ncbi:MAG: DNA polymerase III subunit gamma and tau [Actinomycetota bacterium]|nr:MAG: DNA polymerase III subunit gamma and tau [Actinomycetota bacterium]
MSLALYRTYRPGRLSEVVGQEHVTEPLRRALERDLVHHAYLFSGPRGCGKTSTARILARSLNCEQGPTPDPCGVCPSCVDLAPNGPGSLDVIELDAASHGGVDDTRDLRERAMFAPAASRYKIYIIDEAHMVTSAGFNALLKLVEEPPEHVRFMFATTEVDKVLPTIRSRTHNYTFRLIPAKVLTEHLAAVCDAEGVAYERTALTLVARAGAGSARDAMSILGQLIAGAGPDGLTYADAVQQLGATDAALLDTVVEALAVGDGAALFAAVDRVVDAGHDPRRFVTDLLERVRDLVVLNAVPDAATRGLVDGPDDLLARMTTQAESFGLPELSRAGDVISAGLTELKGATAPRLALELLCARLLLPAAAADPAALAARVDRLERRLTGAGPLPAETPIARTPGGPPAPDTPMARSAAGPAPTDDGPGDVAGAPAAQSPGPARPARPAESTRSVAAVAESPSRPPVPPVPAGSPASSGPPVPPVPAGPPARPAAAVRSATASRPTAPAPDASSALPADDAGAVSPAVRPAGDIGSARAQWPAVLDALKARSRVAWMGFESSIPLSWDDGTLAVGVPAQGTLVNIREGGRDEQLRQAVLDVLQVEVRIAVVLDPGVGSRTPVAAAGDVPSAPSGPPPVVPDEPERDDPEEPSAGLTGVDLALRELGATKIGEIENG